MWYSPMISWSSEEVVPRNLWNLASSTMAHWLIDSSLLLRVLRKWGSWRSEKNLVYRCFLIPGKRTSSCWRISGWLRLTLLINPPILSHCCSFQFVKHWRWKTHLELISHSWLRYFIQIRRRTISSLARAKQIKTSGLIHWEKLSTRASTSMLGETSPWRSNI